MMRNVSCLHIINTGSGLGQHLTLSYIGGNKFNVSRAVGRLQTRSAQSEMDSFRKKPFTLPLWPDHNHSYLSHLRFVLFVLLRAGGSLGLLLTTIIPQLAAAQSQ